MSNIALAVGVATTGAVGMYVKAALNDKVEDECHKCVPASARGMVAPCALGHVTLLTSDMQRVKDFYLKVLPTKVVLERENVVLLGDVLEEDDELFRICIVRHENLATAPCKNAASPGLVGVDHISFTFPSFDALFANYERCKGLGLLPVWPVHHGATLSMYYTDPLGTKVELQVDTLQAVDPATGEITGSIDWDAAIAYLESAGFSENPVGVEYSPKDLITAFRSGKITPAELRERPPPGDKERAMMRGIPVLMAGKKLLDASPAMLRKRLLVSPNEGQFTLEEDVFLGNQIPDKRNVRAVSSVPRPSKFAHFVLGSNQVANMSAWYRRVLCTESIFNKHDFSNFMTYDDEHHRLACVFAPGLKRRPRNSVGVSHVTFYYESLQELAHTYKRLRNLNGVVDEAEPHWVRASKQPFNLRPFACRRGGPLTSLFYHDPDGNVLELAHRDRTLPREQLLRFYETASSFPFGEPFDADDFFASFLPASKL